MNKDSSFLDKELKLLESYFDKRDIGNAQVSKATVDWHIDHSLKTILSICNALLISDPTKFKKRFSLPWFIMDVTGFIPRGFAQAPKKVRPPDIILLKDLERQLNEVKIALVKIEKLPAHAHFEHPVFKQLNRDQGLRFILIHTKHHLKIIKDF